MAEPSSRRAGLERAQPVKGSTHPGLWFDKFLTLQERAERERGGEASGGEKDSKPRASLMEQTASLGEPEGYKRAFTRWQAQLEALAKAQRVAEGSPEADAPDARAVLLQTQPMAGRLAVGLGGDSVSETAIALHHTWGTPYIPGSALKGLAAATAHKLLADEGWRKPGRVPIPRDRPDTAFLVVFGDTVKAGHVTFFDAWYVPGSASAGRMLEPDVLTVHHPDYYRGIGDPPADWDSPNPVSFLTAQGSYLLAVAGPKPWAEVALEILSLGLQELGVGAKTSSGYGFAERGETPRPKRPGDEEHRVRPEDSGLEPSQAPLPPQILPKTVEVTFNDLNAALEARRAQRRRERREREPRDAWIALRPVDPELASLATGLGINLLTPTAQEVFAAREAAGGVLQSFFVAQLERDGDRLIAGWAGVSRPPEE